MSQAQDKYITITRETRPVVVQFNDNILASTKEALIHQKWGVDTARLRTSLNGLANFGGYFPQFRALNESHCTTVLDFANGDIQERGLELQIRDECRT